MAVQKFARIFENFPTILGGGTGTVTGLLFLRAVVGTIVRIDIFSGANLESFPATFNVRKDGAPLFSGGGRPQIAVGQQSVSKTGLSVSVALGDKLTLDLESYPKIPQMTPVYWIVWIDDGAGDGGGGVAPAQQIISATTASIADNADGSLDPALGKYALLSRLSADRASRVRLYSTAAHRTADAARSIGVDPAGEHGVLLDAVIEAGNLSLDLSPVVSLFDGETVRTGAIAASITNLSGATGTVAVSFSVLILEN